MSAGKGPQGRSAGRGGVVSREPRSWGWLGAWAGVGLVAVGLVVMSLLASAGKDAWLGRVQVHEFAASEHKEGPLEYALEPPAGGPHNAAWQNCGFYSAEVPAEQAVHSLEHGAVWVTYASSVPAGVREELREWAAGNPYLLVSRNDGQAAPLVASAWNHQLSFEDASDPALRAFVDRFSQGAQTPEPGAPCWGGVGTPS